MWESPHEMIIPLLPSVWLSGGGWRRENACGGVQASSHANGKITEALEEGGCDVAIRGHAWPLL